ncbi:TM2 domain-containing protein [Microbacterium terregens]|uniref:TM2 domain-containing protein n=1 Tax=Microbacterium terregens TaxID=69363 RepID=A0ABV5SYS8_9MICO
MTGNAPAALPGWYPVPGGGNRFWNGREWTPDVIGAPDAKAEFAALAPDLPAPRTVVLAPRPQVPLYPPPQAHASVVPRTPSAGWYPGPAGMMQWWDGQMWGPYAPQAARPAKEIGIAYLFFFLLGGVAAHRFYLGRTGSAVLLLCLWMGGWLLSPILIGIPLVIAGGIWLLVDLFLLPSMVREANTLRMNVPSASPRP